MKQRSRRTDLFIIAMMAALTAALGCANGSGRGLREYAAAEVLPLAGPGGADTANAADPSVEPAAVVELVSMFYDTPFAPETLEAKIAAVLAQHPDSATAHEIAGYWATINGELHTAWTHFFTAARDVRSPLVALYLHELEAVNRTTAELNADERLFAMLAVMSPDPAVRTLARQRRIERLRDQLRLEEADALLVQQRYIDSWRMIGVFDNDQGKGFYTTYPPEEGIDFSAEMQGKIMPVRWREVPRLDPYGGVPLGDLLAPNEHVLAYLVTFVRSPTARPAELRLTVGGAVQVWLNDRLVASEEKIEGADDDNLIVPVDLAVSWNKLLVKSANEQGTWQLAARITGPGGEPFDDLTVSRDLQTTVASGKAAATPLVAPFAPAALARVASPGRRSFLTSRFAVAAGRELEDLPSLEALLHASPESPAARYFTALSYWDHDELGKAIDLLSAGVRDYGDKARGFLVKRARYYVQKKRWDKAQADLQLARTAAADDRAAVMQLEELYRTRGWTIERCLLLDESVRKWPDSAWMWGQLASCLDDRGYDDRAARALETAAALEPGNLTYQRRLQERAVERRDFDEAGRRLAVRRALAPTWATPALEECELLRRIGQRERALPCYAAVEEQIPDWAGPYQRHAELLFESDRRDEATAFWELAAQRDPKNSALAERLEFLSRKGLGALEKYVPSEAMIQQTVDHAAEVEVLPGAQVVWLLDHEASEIGNDGSSRRVITSVMLGIGEEGVNQLTKQELPSRGRLQLLLAYSIGKDGTRQEASSLQGSTLRFRRLDPGAIVVLQYVYYAPPGEFLPNHFAATWTFQGARQQMEDSRWVLVHPKGRFFNASIAGDGIEAETHDEGEDTVHTYAARHVPPLIEEPYMPPQADLLRRVSVTTVASWDEYVRWERALLSEAFRSSPEIEALARRLTEGAASPQAKLDALFEFVTRQIRYQQEYETTIAGVRPHAAPVVLERGYGDCKDKAVLLIRLAKVVGIRVDLALLRTRDHGALVRDIPNQQFNHAIVHVPEQEGLPHGFFMDPTTDGLDLGNLRADDQGAVSLVMSADGDAYQFIAIPYQGPDLQFERHALRVRVASPTLGTAVDDVLLRGTSASRARVLLRNKEVANRALQGLANGLFPGATLGATSNSDTEDLRHPLTLHLEMEVGSAIKPEGDTWRFDLPTQPLVTRAGTLAARHTPVFFGAPESGEVQAEVEIPQGYRIVHVPDPFTLTHACFAARRESKLDGNKAIVTVAVERRCTSVSLAEYPEFRQAVQKLVSSLANEVVFARAEAAAPSVVQSKTKGKGGR